MYVHKKRLSKSTHRKCIDDSITQRMDRTWSSVPWLILVATFVILLVIWVKAKKRGLNRLRPPGPPTWPIIGNLLDIGTMPHQTLYDLKFKYGPLLWLQLGFINTMVVQSPNSASELFKNYDDIFCDRTVPHALTAHGYREGSPAMGRYGKNWQLLRRLCFTRLRRINETISLRRKCVDNMIRWIEEDSKQSRAQGGSGAVDICHFLFLMAFNVVGNIVLSRDILDPESKEGREFSDAMNMVMEWAGKPNIADFFPFLKPFDPLRIKKNMERDMWRAKKIISVFVAERVEEKKQLGRVKTGKDLLDVILESKEEPNECDRVSDRNVTTIIMEMFFAGSETTSSTIEWAMAELLRNPATMTKVQQELDRVIGTERKVEESDIDNLHYLQAVIKETLRLHPPVPLLVPRNSMQDCEYMGYFIPQNTQVYVNVWAIGRDPESWDDPLSFKPERFLDKAIEYKGQHFELIPFGSGRRICVGLSLAHRVIHLALASMLQSFDWEIDGVIDPASTDMNERMGIALRKLIPLKAIPKKRVSTY